MPANCVTCDRTFGSDSALQQHVRDSPAHSQSFSCEACSRTFNSNDALQQHLTHSTIHQPQIKTPLDEFFLSFEGFAYDASQPPATSYTRLEKYQNWRRGTTASVNAWNEYQDALESEVRMWYGSDDSLTAWHALCRAIGITPLPQTCKHCEKVVRRTHVNIVDLIEWGRVRGRGGSEKPVRTFRNLTELQEYTKKTRKIYSNNFRGDGRNVVLRNLLRVIF